MQISPKQNGCPASLRQRGYRYALTLTRDVDCAEDLVQEAWVALLSARGPQGFGYLCCAIRSRYVDAHRRRGPEALEDVDAAVASVQQSADPVRTSRGDVGPDAAGV